MTTTVKVHVNGRYEATVTHKVDGEIQTTITVGPQEEKSIGFAHDGKQNTFEIVERQLPAEESGGIPDAGFSAQQAAEKAEGAEKAE
jgi:hypothetical protein